MSVYVLVHGACHDGSAFDRVAAHMRERGHTVFTPTVAGHGKGVDKRVTFAESAQSIVDFIVEQSLIDFVLVGHSYGGTIIAKAAEVLSDRIRRLVFWSGMILEDGETLLDVFPPQHRQLFGALAAASADNTVTLPFDVWREVFINDADLDTAKWAYEQLSPEPYPPMSEPLNFKVFKTLTIPRSYLLGTEDTVMPPGEWGWHPRLSSRLGVYRFVQMPGSHELVFSNPIGLAEKIIEAGRD